MKTNFSKLIFNGIAIALAVAVIVGNIAHAISVPAATTALAIGVAAIGLANLQR
jgi:hypothetical protein